MRDVEVSVLCTVYNHEKYLRQCLDGFVNQKTTFRYEVIVNDDCSQDASAEILKEYNEKYPGIFKLVLQSENQYSKGVRIIDDVLFPISTGKYIALCEGDDYWRSADKLQKQYDWMQTHPDCSMCVHNTLICNLRHRHFQRRFSSWKKSRMLNQEDVFMGWKVHTTSYFIRRQFFILPDVLRGYWFGDYARLTYAFSKGKIAYLPEVMSVYNYNNPEGVTYINNHSDIKVLIEKSMLRKEYLEKYNDYTNYCFNDIISRRIDEIRFDAFVIEKSFVLSNTQDKSVAVSTAKSVFKNEYYKIWINNMSFVNRMKTEFKYRGYWLYPIWKSLWEEYASNK